jgi:hypothetical protein
VENNNRDALIAYFNDVLARHEERIVVLTGRTEYARFGFELTGADFVRSRKIEGKTLDELVDNCIKQIIGAGIAKSITYTPSPLPKPEGAIKFEVKGCIHFPKEVKLKEDKVTPFICPLGNILSAVILENGKFEMGSVGNRAPNAINYETGECSLTGQLCENIDKALKSLNLG